MKRMTTDPGSKYVVLFSPASEQALWRRTLPMPSAPGGLSSKIEINDGDIRAALLFGFDPERVTNSRAISRNLNMKVMHFPQLSLSFFLSQV